MNLTKEYSGLRLNPDQILGTEFCHGELAHAAELCNRICRNEAQ